MLSWPNYFDWRKDNTWHGLDTAPRGTTIDVFAHLRLPERECPIGRRFHGCVLTAEGLHGLPEGWRPVLWAEPMSAKRIRLRTVA